MVELVSRAQQTQARAGIKRLDDAIRLRESQRRQLTSAQAIRSADRSALGRRRELMRQISSDQEQIKGQRKELEIVLRTPTVEQIQAEIQDKVKRGDFQKVVQRSASGEARTVAGKVSTSAGVFTVNVTGKATPQGLESKLLSQGVIIKEVGAQKLQGVSQQSRQLPGFEGGMSTPFGAVSVPVPSQFTSQVFGVRGPSQLEVAARKDFVRVGDIPEAKQNIPTIREAIVSGQQFVSTGLESSGKFIGRQIDKVKGPPVTKIRTEVITDRSRISERGTSFIDPTTKQFGFIPKEVTRKVNITTTGETEETKLGRAGKAIGDIGPFFIPVVGSGLLLEQSAQALESSKQKIPTRSELIRQNKPENLSEEEWRQFLKTEEGKEFIKQIDEFVKKLKQGATTAKIQAGVSASLAVLPFGVSGARKVFGKRITVLPTPKPPKIKTQTTQIRREIISPESKRGTVILSAKSEGISPPTFIKVDTLAKETARKFLRIPKDKTPGILKPKFIQQTPTIKTTTIFKALPTKTKDGLIARGTQETRRTILDEQFLGKFRPRITTRPAEIGVSNIKQKGDFLFGKVKTEVVPKRKTAGSVTNLRLTPTGKADVGASKITVFTGSDPRSKLPSTVIKGDLNKKTISIVKEGVRTEELVASKQVPFVSTPLVQGELNLRNIGGQIVPSGFVTGTVKKFKTLPAVGVTGQIEKVTKFKQITPSLKTNKIFIFEPIKVPSQTGTVKKVVSRKTKGMGKLEQKQITTQEKVTLLQPPKPQRTVSVKRKAKQIESQVSAQGLALELKTQQQVRATQKLRSTEELVNEGPVLLQPIVSQSLIKDQEITSQPESLDQGTKQLQPPLLGSNLIQPTAQKIPSLLINPPGIITPSSPGVPKIPRPITPGLPVTNILVLDRVLAKKVASKLKAYDVFVKKQGKFRKVADDLPKGRALRRGAQITQNTISSTFKIKRDFKAKARPTPDIKFKPDPKVYRTYKVVKGKRRPLPKNTYIERKTKRLTTRGAISDILSSRKGRKFF